MSDRHRDPRYLLEFLTLDALLNKFGHSCICNVFSVPQTVTGIEQAEKTVPPGCSLQSLPSAHSPCVLLVGYLTMHPRDPESQIRAANI